MGSLHAEKVSSLARAGEDVALVGIADPRRERADALARRTGTIAASSISDLLPGADAVIVATPTISHFDVVRDALKSGCDVLVEKPIAATLAEGEALLRTAAQADRLLQVGHLEWFNAALRSVRAHIDRPRFIEAHRMGPFSDRSTDVDVVRDLMIHDLDIVCRLLGETPDQVDAAGVPVLTDEVDVANARLGFPSGCVANFTASRVSSAPVRELRFFQPNGYLSVDFLEPSAVSIRRVFDADGTPRMDVESLAIDPSDSLLSQLRAFLDAIRTRSRPRVDGTAGLEALRTSLRVLTSMPPLDEL